MIIVIAMGFIVVIASIIVGIKSFDGIVTENPYEEGLKWDKRNEEIEELGLVIEVKNREFRTGDNDILIGLYKNDGTPYNSTSIRLYITRPSTDRYDMEVIATRIGDGLYKTSINLPIYGYWQVIIRHEGLEEDIIFKKEIFVEKGG